VSELDAANGQGNRVQWGTHSAHGYYEQLAFGLRALHCLALLCSAQLRSAYLSLAYVTGRCAAQSWVQQAFVLRI
jgi:hypothetical protein